MGPGVRRGLRGEGRGPTTVLVLPGPAGWEGGWREAGGQSRPGEQRVSVARCGGGEETPGQPRCCGRGRRGAGPRRRGLEGLRSCGGRKACSAPLQTGSAKGATPNSLPALTLLLSGHHAMIVGSTRWPFTVLNTAAGAPQASPRPPLSLSHTHSCSHSHAHTCSHTRSHSHSRPHSHTHSRSHSHIL